MSCKTCIDNGCRGFSFYHHEDGCQRCLCSVAYKTLIDIKSKEGPTMKQFDKRGQNAITKFFKLQKKYAKRYKRFYKVFSEFGVGYFIFSGGYIAAVAGIVADLIEVWLFILLLIMSTLLGYNAQKFSEDKIRIEFQERLEALRKEFRNYSSFTKV